MFPRVEASRIKKNKPSLADYVIRVFNTAHVHIVARNGIVYEGILVGKNYGFLVLRDVTIHGKKYVAKVSYCLVRPEIIQHIHPKPLELKEIKSEE